MALKRVWTPTGSCSGGGTKDLIVIHTMEGFTGPNGALDCAKYFQGDVGASSQVCIDNNRGTIWECVSRYDGAWTQCNYNSRSVSAEQSGYASWSRDYWLNNRGNQLHNMADWIAEESKKLGIPITNIGSGGSNGVIYHSELGSSGCGHSDPGGGFPLDKVLEWAKGGGGSAPETTGGIDVSGAVYDGNGGKHLVGVGTNGVISYRPPDRGWVNIAGSKCKSLAGITRNPANGRLLISYTNTNSEFCTYDKAEDDDPDDWGWTSYGGGSFR